MIEKDMKEMEEKWKRETKMECKIKNLEKKIN